MNSLLCNKISFSHRNDYKQAISFIIKITLAIILCLLLFDIQVNSVMASGDAFKAYLSNGAFEDSADRELTGPAYFVMQAVNIFLGQALPIMSICSITFILWSLISTVLYLFRQEYFDDVYLAKKQKRSEKSSLVKKLLSKDRASIFSSGAASEFGFFKTYICPDLKSWAFFEASTESMTVSDFFKQNFAKCILMFAFCMLISDRTMLDMFVEGASIGTYLFEKVTYDYDYVAIIDGLAQSGSDYTPTFQTSTTQGKNLSKIYNASYKLLKTYCNTTYTRGAEFKHELGRTLEAEVNKLPGIDDDLTTLLGNKTFVVTAMGTQDTTIAKNSSYDSSSRKIVFPVSTLTANTKGFDTKDTVVPNYITLLITSSADVDKTVVVNTTGKWESGKELRKADGTSVGANTGTEAGVNSATWQVQTELGDAVDSGSVTLTTVTSKGNASATIKYESGKAIITGGNEYVEVTADSGRIIITAKNCALKTVSVSGVNNLASAAGKHITATSRAFNWQSSQQSK